LGAGTSAASFSSISNGSSTICVVPSRHGPLPLPAPAVLELLGGASLYGRTVEAELITPTGAAILAEYAASFGKMPSMTVASVGYGAGSRELEIPNVLRVVLGEPSGDSAVEPPEAVENQGDIPGALTDQGDRLPAPTRNAWKNAD